MANKAAQFRAQAQNIWSGATVVERGRGHIRHQHPSNPLRFMIDNSIGKIHYGPLQDQEIDTAWVATGGGAFDWQMTLNDFQTFARDTFNAGDIFQFEKDGETLTLDPQSLNWIDENTSRQQIAIKQPVAASASDDTITFTDAYGSGAHFEYRNQTARLQKLLTIDSAGFLPTPTLGGSTIWLELEFTLSPSSGLDIYLDGVLWTRQNGVRVQTADRIEFRRNSDGVTLWWFDFPRAWDTPLTGEDAQTVIGEMEVRRQGGPSNLFVTVRIPKTWIDTANFPIFVDPTIDEQVGASADDAWEASSTSVNITGTTITNVDSSGEWGGVRIDNITMSGTIDVSYLTVECPTASLDEPQITLSGEDNSTPAAFTTTNGDISNRTLTSNSVSWDDTGLGAPGFFNSPSLNTIIQELVDTYSYSSGAIVIVWTSTSGDGTRDFSITAYDGSTTNCAAIHIEYTTSGGSRRVFITSS